MGNRGDWFILRTASRHTMSLAESLGKDGYEVWTPIETRKVRVPRVNAKREVRLPIMPSYVFVAAAHLLDMLALAAMPFKPRRGAGLLDPAHASFSVMRWDGKIPMVCEKHLERLRELEAKRTPIKRAAYAFPRNASARVKEGVFGGLSGTVIRSTPAKTVVSFNNGPPVEIPTSLFDQDVLLAYQPEGTAALEAA